MRRIVMWLLDAEILGTVRKRPYRPRGLRKIVYRFERALLARLLESVFGTCKDENCHLHIGVCTSCMAGYLVRLIRGQSTSVADMQFEHIHETMRRSE